MGYEGLAHSKKGCAVHGSKCCVPDLSSENIAPAKPPGHDRDGPNPNIEIRNPKQIQSANDVMTQTDDSKLDDKNQIGEFHGLEYSNFGHSILFRISIFEFRALPIESLGSTQTKVVSFFP
jgi:hypothetical protein